MRPFSPVLVVLVLGATAYLFGTRAHHSRPIESGGPTDDRLASRPTAHGRARRVAAGPGEAAGPTARLEATTLGALLDRWVRDELISSDQRAAILTHERAAPADHDLGAPATRPVAPPRGGRLPATAEAIGYLGGVLATVGLALIVIRAWPDLATSSRLAMTGSASVALLLAGGGVHEGADPALARLRWFLWLAATATTALFAGVIVVDALDGSMKTTVLAGSVAAAVLSGVLWRGADRPVQQLTCSAGGVVAVGALTAQVSARGAVGLAVWFAGVALVALGLRRMLPQHVMTEGLGAVSLVVGAAIAADDWTSIGMLLLVATALGLLGLVDAMRLDLDRIDRLVLGVVGVIALLQGVPGALGWFSHDAGGITGLVTWSVGALLVHLGAQGLVRLPLQTELAGGAALLGGAALTGVEWHGAAPVIGLVTAIALVSLGTRPGQVLLSVLGSAGLLINVPWAIGWFFPGEGRAPLLIMVSGALLIAIAVVLTRMGDRFRRELGPRPRTSARQ